MANAAGPAGSSAGSLSILSSIWSCRVLFDCLRASRSEDKGLSKARKEVQTHAIVRTPRIVWLWLVFVPS
jgi:hypothetical protein